MKDFNFARVSIGVAGINICNNSFILDQLYDAVCSATTSVPVINKYSYNLVMFSNIDKRDITKVSSRLEHVCQSFPSANLSVERTCLSGYFGKSSGVCKNRGLPEFSASTPKDKPKEQSRTIKLVPNAGEALTLVDHRYILDLCSRYGGDKEKIFGGSNFIHNQKEKGIFIRDIPLNNFPIFLSKLRERFSDRFSFNYGDESLDISQEYVL